MIDREKVIEGLENIKSAIIAAICYKDDYGSEHDLNCLDDAITLLKEQEPRVLTLNEIQEGGGYWLCVSGDLVSRPVICVYKEMDAQKPYITFAWQFGTTSWDTAEYGTGWRCWSSRPTDEQRKAMKWV